ncbi:MAG: hypothetical protein H6819_00180 [Phycisphaerales bacterium]|nr:hypothetical protein [Phycisphaerales bacterium]MCB9857375.1 hypothetical protein [Phycisphaerales bacterium]
MWWLRLDEMKHYPTENDRRDVVRRWEATRALPSKGLMIFLALFIIGPALAVPMDYLVSVLGLWSVGVFLVFLVVVGFAMRAWYSELRSKRFREFVRNDLLSMRICWQCGYDLTGNETGICSECGLKGVNVVDSARAA